jgi:hypothetical protein
MCGESGVINEQRRTASNFADGQRLINTCRHVSLHVRHIERAFTIPAEGRAYQIKKCFIFGNWVGRAIQPIPCSFG